MNAPKYLLCAVSLSVLTACSIPNTAAETGKPSLLTSVTGASISGVIQIDEATNPKLALIEAEGETDAAARKALINAMAATNDSERWLGASIISPASDGTYRIALKSGTKAITMAAVFAWDDANGDGRAQITETTRGRTLTSQSLTQFRLTNIAFSEVAAGRPVTPAQQYDWTFKRP